MGEERSRSRIRADSRIGNESRKYAVRVSGARRPAASKGGINHLPAAEMSAAIGQRLGRQSLASCWRRPNQQSQKDGETKLKVARTPPTVAGPEGAIPLGLSCSFCRRHREKSRCCVLACFAKGGKGAEGLCRPFQAGKKIFPLAEIQGAALRWINEASMALNTGA